MWDLDALVGETQSTMLNTEQKVPRSFDDFVFNCQVVWKKSLFLFSLYVYVFAIHAFDKHKLKRLEHPAPQAFSPPKKWSNGNSLSNLLAENLNQDGPLV